MIPGKELSCLFVAELPSIAMKRSQRIGALVKPQSPPTVRWIEEVVTIPLVPPLNPTI